MRQHSVTRVLCGLLTVFMLCTLLPAAAFADDGEETAIVETASATNGYQETTISYHYKGFIGNDCLCEVPFSDGYFVGDPTEYNHHLAQASIGLATASMRIKDAKDQAANVKDYLTQAGFDNLTLEGYDKETSKDTVSTAIASREEDGYTLVVVTVCSGGYKNEWLSNLTVGSGEEHEGFSYAAGIVEGRVLRFLASHHITGKVKLWSTGFSRGAAVSNLVCGHLMEMDIFDAIYGYFFATPRNTKNPVAYENLFNILGKFDPVTMVPLAEWGYGRYGRELYVKAQQTDSDWMIPFLNASADYYENAGGVVLTNNPEVAQQLRNALECLSRVFPTSEEYAANLQPLLIAAYSANATDDPLVLINAIRSFSSSGLTTSELEALKAFFNYLSASIVLYTRGNSEQIKLGNWDESTSVAHNIVREHESPTYLYWLMSSENPDDIYSDSCQYVRLIIEGNVTADIYCGSTWCGHISENSTNVTDTEEGMEDYMEDLGLLEEDVSEETEENVSSLAPVLHHSYDSGRTVIDVPLDREYSILVTGLEDGEIRYYPIYCDTRNNTSRLDGVTSVSGRAGTVHDIYVTKDQETGEPIVDSSDVTALTRAYSNEEALSIILKAEHISTSYLSLGGMQVIAYIVLGLLGILIILSFVRLIHRIVKKKPATGMVRIISIAITYVFLILAFLAIKFFVPSNRRIPLILLIIGGFFTIIVVVGSVMRNRAYRKSELKRQREAKDDPTFRREDPGEITDSED